MSIDVRAGTTPNGEPFGLILATGTHDLSRMLGTFDRGNCEQYDAARTLRRQARGTANTRRAMRLLADHGGPEFVYADDAAPDAVELLREECREIEREYVNTLNALLAHPGSDDWLNRGNSGDYDRWTGKAEALRFLAERLRRRIGDDVPAYGSSDWRQAHGVYTERQANEWRERARQYRSVLDFEEPAAICDIGRGLALHLVRRLTTGGTPGPTLCGIDRFGAGVGFSTGGAYRPGAAEQWQAVRRNGEPPKPGCPGCLVGRDVLIEELGRRMVGSDTDGDS